ncbi:hypothetical protein HN011_010355 [Eciton burchellii]|nr:hypothetical protein HN011_010355 [Eciton burchellii]
MVSDIHVPDLTRQDMVSRDEHCEKQVMALKYIRQLLAMNTDANVRSMDEMNMCDPVRFFSLCDSASKCPRAP